MGLFIEDGYTLKDKIPANPPLHREVVYSYRPATLARRREWLDAESSDARNAIWRKLLIDHVVEIREGDDVPVQATMFKQMVDRVWPSVGLRMLDCILGYAGPSEVTDAKN